MKKKIKVKRARAAEGGPGLRRTIHRLKLELEKSSHLATFPKLNPMPVCEVGSNGRIRYMNAAARKAFPGLSPASRAHPWIDGIKEKLLPQFASAKKRIAHREVAIGDRWFEQTLYYVAREQLIRIYGRDITKRKQAELAVAERNEELYAINQELMASNQEMLASELALRDSEAKLRAIFETSIDAIGVSREGVHITANPAYLALFGYGTGDDLTGTPVIDLIAPSQRRTVTDIIRRRAGGQAEPAGYETRGLRKDGTEFDMDVRLSTYALSGVTFTMVILRDITQRRQIEQALQVSETRYRRLFETAKDGILILDAATGMIVDINPFLSELLGYPRDKLLGREVWELDPFKDIIANRQKFRELQQAEYIRYDDRPLETADGHRIDVEFVSNVYLVDHQKVIQCNIRDITERKKVEETQAFLLQNAFPGKGKKYFDSLARYLAQNLGMDYVCIDRLLGDGLTAQTVSVFSDGKFEDNVTYALKDTPCGAVVGKEICCFPRNVQQLYPRDQVLRQMAAESYIGTTLWNLTGNVIGLIAAIGRKPLPKPRLAESVLRLVAIRAASELERQLVDEALQVSETRYRRLFETAKDGILILDAATGMIVDVNPFLMEMLGYPHSTFVGKKVWELGFIHDIVANREKFLELQQKEYVRYEDKPLETADGRRMDVEFVSNVYLVDHQKVIQCNIRDITQRKHLEMELLQYRDNLQHQIERRTSELVQRTSELDAARRLSDIGTLAATVAHELRNPLAAIRMAAYNIKRKAALPALDKHLDTIDKKVSDSDRIINNLLFYSRIRTVESQTLNVGALLDDVVEQLAGRNNGTKLPITRAYPGLANQAIEADPLLLRELFENVLSNSLDAIPAANGTIEVSGDVRGDGDLVITVTDNGCGIEPETLAKVFEPFFSTKSKGTGLGLAVSRQIAQLHGGSIAIDSAPGRGTAVTIAIPLRKGRP